MRNYNIPFLKYSRSAFIFSALVIIIGAIALAATGLNLGIDFAGGTIVHLRLDEGFQMEEVREVLAPFGLAGVPLQRAGRDGAGEGREVIIKTPELDEAARRELIEAFNVRWPQMTNRDVLRIDNVGAVIGRELTQEAFLALLIAALLMIVYITMRFEFKFALAAIIALFHDAFIIVGLFSLFQLEVNSPFIAAVLTIIGYSINDTIVIFDRIRENLKYRGKRTIEEVVESSINANLVRSINTSLTTLVVLLSLFIAFSYFVGGMDLKVFALALLIGIVSGTYSSIFIASPVWLILQNREKRKKAPAHS
jgi:preprotein translocase SecF subunit